tara:strand:- start:544 stop:1035 length:492 start_codon:yes stop_codon:yes gene_type:complete
MRFVYQPLGTVSLVGIESNNEQEIIEQYYSLWNHGATGGKLHWMCDTFAYVTSNEEALEKYFVNSSFHLLLNKYPEKYKGVKGGVMADVRKLAARRLAELKENSEVFMSTNPVVYDYSLGRTEARENPSPQVNAFDEEAFKQSQGKRDGCAEKSVFLKKMIWA